MQSDTLVLSRLRGTLGKTWLIVVFGIAYAVSRLYALHDREHNDSRTRR